MKNIIIIISLLLALTTSSTAENKSEKAQVASAVVKLAETLMNSFGGEDAVLNEKETIEVLIFLQTHLPKQTGPDGLTTRPRRENNARSAEREETMKERRALREYTAEEYVTQFIQKYDRNEDGELSSCELSYALAKIIGRQNTKIEWIEIASSDRRDHLLYHNIAS